MSHSGQTPPPVSERDVVCAVAATCHSQASSAAGRYIVSELQRLIAETSTV